MKAIFTKKKLSTEEKAGERLRQARSFLNLSLEEASNKTKIKQEYLLAIENENYDLLPSGLYAKNFIKTYSLFLKLDPKEILKKSPFNQFKQTFKEDNPFSKKILAAKNFLVFPKIARNILLILIILACFLYLSIYLFKSREAPSLIIFEPTNNISVEEQALKISGQTDIKAEVKINGVLVNKDEQGFFSIDINLRKGINRIIIESSKKNSKKNIIERQILVK
jgi:cytoskeletal protein RodZ